MLRFSAQVNVDGIDNLIKAAGPSSDVAIARALNRVGAPVRTKYLREVRKELGLTVNPYVEDSAPPKKIVESKTSTLKARPRILSYSVVGFGKGFDLLHFGARETRKGISAKIFGRRFVTPNTFMFGASFAKGRRGGFAPKHRTSKLRLGPGRYNIKKALGPSVPEAMTLSGPQSVWETDVSAKLGPRLKHELLAILQGYAPKVFG